MRRGYETLLTLGLLLLLLATAPAASAVEPTGSISGVITVNGEAPKEPVSVIVFGEAAPGVFTRLPEQPAVEESEGAYKIPKLADGAYKLKFVPASPALAYRYYGEAVTLAAGQTAVVAGGNPTPSIDVKLQPGAAIRGIVTDAVTNAPLSGATVEARVEGAGGELAATVSTAVDGGYEITGLPAASYRVNFLAGEHVAKEVTGVTPPAGGPAETENAALTPDPPHLLSAPQSVPPAAPVPPPTPAAPAPPGAPVAAIALSTTKLLFVKHAAAALLTCTSAPCAGTLVLTEPVIVTRLRGGKVISRKRLTLTLATGAFSLAAGRSAKVLLRLTKVGRARLKATATQRLPGILVISLRGAVPLMKTVLFSARAPARRP